MALKMWKILLKLNRPADESRLTCDECFALLDILTSCLPDEDPDEMLYEAAMTHLKHCPHCTEHHQQLLSALAAKHLPDE